MVEGRGKIGLQQRQKISISERLTRSERIRARGEAEQREINKRQAIADAKTEQERKEAEAQEAFLNETVVIDGRNFTRRVALDGQTMLNKFLTTGKPPIVSTGRQKNAFLAYQALVNEGGLELKRNINKAIGSRIAAQEAGFRTIEAFQAEKGRLGTPLTEREQQLISGQSLEQFRESKAQRGLAEVQRQDIILTPQERKGFISKVITEGTFPSIVEDFATGEKRFLNTQELKELESQKQLEEVEKEAFDPFKARFEIGKEKVKGFFEGIKTSESKFIKFIIGGGLEPKTLLGFKTSTGTEEAIKLGAFVAPKVPNAVEKTLLTFNKGLSAIPIKVPFPTEGGRLKEFELVDLPQLSSNILRGLRSTGEISAEGFKDILGETVKFESEADVTTRKLIKSGLQRSIPFIARAAPETAAFLAFPASTATVIAASASQRLKQLDVTVEKQVSKEIQAAIKEQDLNILLPEQQEIIRKFREERTPELTKATRKQLLLEGGIALGFLAIKGVSAGIRFTTREIPLRTVGGKVSKLQAIELKIPKGSAFRAVQVRTARRVTFTTGFRKTFGLKPLRTQVIQPPQIKVFTTPRFTKVGKPFLLDVQKVSKPPVGIRTTQQAFKFVREGAKLGKTRELIIIGKSQKLSRSLLKQLAPTLSKKELKVFQALIKDPLKGGAAKGVKFRSDIFAIEVKRQALIFKVRQGLTTKLTSAKLIRGKIAITKTRAITQELEVNKRLIKATTKQILFKSQLGRAGQVRTATTRVLVLDKAVKFPFKLTGRRISKDIISNIDDLIARSSKGQVIDVIKTSKGIGKRGSLAINAPPRFRITQRSIKPDVILQTQRTLTLPKPAFLIKESTLAITKETTSTLSALIPAILAKSLSRQLPKAQTITKVVSQFKTITQEKTILKSALKSVALPKSILKPALPKITTIPIIPRIPRIPRSPRVPKALFPILPSASPLRAERGGREAYVVQTRVKGMWVNVSQERFTKSGALNFGAEVTDRSIAASFRIRKAIKKGKRPREWGGYLDLHGNKFRPFKSRKDLGLMGAIEKKRFRLDTLGEVRKIQAARLAAQILGKQRRKKGFVSPRFIEPTLPKLNFKGIPA